MPNTREIVGYIRDALVILIVVSVGMYVLSHPDESIREVVKLQEDAGLEGITDIRTAVIDPRHHDRHDIAAMTAGDPAKIDASLNWILGRH